MRVTEITRRVSVYLVVDKDRPLTDQAQTVVLMPHLGRYVSSCTCGEADCEHLAAAKRAATETFNRQSAAFADAIGARS